jgi:predicted GNAT superfamily acetyltransferase
VPLDDVTIREATSLDDLAAMIAVFEAIWGQDGQPALNITRAMQHAGGYAALAEEGDRVVAASLGFLGREADGAPLLHSHITGALGDATNRGIGFAVKQHQRAWCLDRGIETITWTFDPLVRRNAHFNLGKLGARATEYHADFYGPMEDAVNGGDETDRIVARWDLATEEPVDTVAPEDAIVVLTVGSDGEPVVHDAGGATLLHQIPSDYHELRRTDPAVGRAWRHAVRKTLGVALGDGYVGTGVTADGSYVLRRP